MEAAPHRGTPHPVRLPRMRCGFSLQCHPGIPDSLTDEDHSRVPQGVRSSRAYRFRIRCSASCSHEHGSRLDLRSPCGSAQADTADREIAQHHGLQARSGACGVMFGARSRAHARIAPISVDRVVNRLRDSDRCEPGLPTPAHGDTEPHVHHEIYVALSGRCSQEQINTAHPTTCGLSSPARVVCLRSARDRSAEVDARSEHQQEDHRGDESCRLDRANDDVSAARPWRRSSSARTHQARDAVQPVGWPWSVERDCSARIASSRNIAWTRLYVPHAALPDLHADHDAEDDHRHDPVPEQTSPPVVGHAHVGWLVSHLPTVTQLSAEVLRG